MKLADQLDELLGDINFTPRQAEIVRRAAQALRVKDEFLDSIEGAGYGGMASFEIARSTERS